jgi:hypothetical protein
MHAINTPLLELQDHSGYDRARMALEIVLALEAIEDLRRVSARDQAAMRDAMEIHVLAIVAKTDADAWLAAAGRPDENGLIE